MDLGDDIYLWYGKECNEFEKLAALNFAVDQKNHMRQSKAKLHYPQTMGGKVEEVFWGQLAGNKSEVQPAVKESLDASDDVMFAYKLWHIYEQDDKIHGDEIKERPLRRDMLKNDDTYILELYNKIYVW